MFSKKRSGCKAAYNVWRLSDRVVMQNDTTGEHHVALVKGDIGDGENVLYKSSF